MCNKKYACGCLIAVIISIIVAAIVANLLAGLTVAGITTGVIVALIFAGLSLLYLAIVSYHRNSKCICQTGKCLVLGAIGTILSGIIALSITLVLTAASTIFILALVVFFFVLTLISVAILFLCLTECDKMCEY